MQQALQDYVGLLYSNGISYQVKPGYLCPVGVKPELGDWNLYVGKLDGSWIRTGPSRSTISGVEKARSGAAGLNKADFCRSASYTCQTMLISKINACPDLSPKRYADQRISVYVHMIWF